MLPKKQRLNLKTNFRWVASGKSTTSPYFKIFYRFGENDEPKAAVSLVSAQFKKATQRSAAKRICFSLVSSVYNQLPKSVNLVIMPRVQILETDYSILNQTFTNAISNFKAD